MKECLFCEKKHYAKDLCKLCYNLTRTRKKKGQTEDLSVHFKAGFQKGCLRKDGYRVIQIEKIRKLEHVYVMEKFLKRNLIRGESIHHRNGIRHDNRIENLELWTTNHPSGQRVEDKIKWAKEFIALYENID